MSIPCSRIPWIAVCIVGTMLCAGCSQSQTEQPDDVVALVNGYPIDAHFFRTTYVEYLIRSGANDSRTNRYAHLDNLIDAVLLSQEASRLGLDRDSVFQRRLDIERQKAVGAAFFETAFLETLPELTEEQERRAFVLSREKRLVSHLFFRSADEAQASFERLGAGKPFLEEAMQVYNLDAVDSTAGRLGVIGFYQVDPAFAEAAFATAVDSFSAPVRSRFGFHIIRVEEIIRQPLLTESQFQSARSGIARKYRLHIRMRDGDRFVREFMEGLDVRVDDAAIRRLRSAILDIENSVEPQPVDIVEGAEVIAVRPDDVRDLVGAETPLARYNLAGEQIVFTAEDYLRWLPELPFQEARNRTGASVGRAIRNDAFAREGLQRGLLTDSVKTEIDRSARLILSDALRLQLRRDTTTVATPDELERLTNGTRAGGLSDAELRARAAPLLAEFRMLRRLRQTGAVTIDTTRFESVARGANLYF